MKVIVIEDDLILCDSYKYYFKSYPDYTLEGIYNHVEDALENYESTFPDIIISDISFPNMNGVDGIKYFKEKDPNVKILLVSVHDDLHWIKSALKNAADGYLTKPVLKHELYNALNIIKYEGAILSTDVTKKVISSFQKKSLRIFTDREKDIIELLSQGETYKSIATKLYITSSTVNFHIQNIYLKLNVNSKSEALKIIQELD